MDTIFAEATAGGRAGVSVIRLSGPAAFEIAEKVTASELPPPRKAGLRYVRGADKSIIDQALVLCFAAPHSFTGEDVVEFHLHGSLAVVQATLSWLSCFTGARLAEPGEFTRRAMENERLDLTQVEGLVDLIEAETEAQRRQAFRVMSGHLGERVAEWRVGLIRAAALLEATIDFADEDVPVDVTPEVSSLLISVRQSIASEISGFAMAERIRTGFEVAIIGAPNVGKSTLLNALAGREAAITSQIAGTTRDVIEVRMDLGGLPVTLLDTAGLRQSEDEIENIGIERALERGQNADIRVFLAEPDEVFDLSFQVGDIQVRPKGDLLGDVENTISGKTGKGVKQLIDSIQVKLEEKSLSAGLATHARHRAALESSLQFLDQAELVVHEGTDRYDIAAEELRSAIRALEVLVGHIGVEDLLDEIFASFCLGK
jgi:tRNA modification GTPase